MFDLKNKVALVTGGANGIGAEIAREFLKSGARLSHKYDKERVKFIKCDVIKDEELNGSFQKIIAKNSYIDVIVNAAGIANDADFKKEIEINLTATVTCSIKGLQLMRKDKGGKGGTIINISSVSGLTLSSSNIFVYSATKAGFLHFTSSLGKDGYYSKTGVRTICMCFGATETDLLRNLKSFDEEIEKYLENIPMQTAQEAALGTLEAYKTGKSGSVWVVSHKLVEITDQIDKAYDIKNIGW